MRGHTLFINGEQVANLDRWDRIDIDYTRGCVTVINQRTVEGWASIALQPTDRVDVRRVRPVIFPCGCSHLKVDAGMCGQHPAGSYP